MNKILLSGAFALSLVAGLHGSASAQLLSAGRCENAFGVSQATATSRYAWGTYCVAQCQGHTANCPNDAAGPGHPRPYTAFLTDQSIADYNSAAAGTKPFLFPTYFDYTNFAVWDIPATAYPPSVAANNCFALPTSAINAGLCIAGCYTPDTALQFSDGPMGIKAAALASKVDLVTLAPDSTLDNLQFSTNKVQGYTTDMRESVEAIYTFKMSSGGVLNVTSEHPLIDSDGVIRQAQGMHVGDSLVLASGKADPIVSIDINKVFGKVYNVKPTSMDYVSNIVVAGGYLNGSERFQNEFLSAINSMILRRGFSDQAAKLRAH